MSLVLLNPTQELFIDPELVNLIVIGCLIHTNIDIGFVVELVTLIEDQAREMMLRQRKTPKELFSCGKRGIMALE